MSQDTRPDRPDRPRDRRTKPPEPESPVPGPPKPPTAPATLRALDDLTEKAGDFLKNLIQTTPQEVRVEEDGGINRLMDPVGLNFPFTGEVYPDASGGLGTDPAHKSFSIASGPTNPSNLASLIRDMEGFLAVEVPKGLSTGELAPMIAGFITRLKEI